MINELLNQLKWVYTNPSCMEREKAKGYYDAIKKLQEVEKRNNKAIEEIEDAKKFWRIFKPDNSRIAIKHFDKFLEILKGDNI